MRKASQAVHRNIQCGAEKKTSAQTYDPIDFLQKLVSKLSTVHSHIFILKKDIHILHDMY